MERKINFRIFFRIGRKRDYRPGSEFIGASPYGRVDELIRNYRKQAERKELLVTCSKGLYSIGLR